jgi:hypothetical protein
MYSTTSKEDIKRMTVVELQAWLSYHNVPVPRTVSLFLFYSIKVLEEKKEYHYSFSKKII